MKKVILLSCDGINVDIVDEIFVENVNNGVRELFSKVFNNDYVGSFKCIDEILENELVEDDIMYDNIEREFDCGNEWNSIVVMDKNIDVKEVFGKYN